MGHPSFVHRRVYDGDEHALFSVIRHRLNPHDGLHELQVEGEVAEEHIRVVLQGDSIIEGDQLTLLIMDPQLQETLDQLTQKQTLLL